MRNRQSETAADRDRRARYGGLGGADPCGRLGRRRHLRGAHADRLGSGQGYQQRKESV